MTAAADTDAAAASAAASAAVSASDPNNIVIAPVHPCEEETSRLPLEVRADPSRTILTSRSLDPYFRRRSAIREASLPPEQPFVFFMNQAGSP